MMLQEHSECILEHIAKARARVERVYSYRNTQDTARSVTLALTNAKGGRAQSRTHSMRL